MNGHTPYKVECNAYSANNVDNFDGMVEAGDIQILTRLLNSLTSAPYSKGNFSPTIVKFQLGLLWP